MIAKLTHQKYFMLVIVFLLALTSVSLTFAESGASGIYRTNFENEGQYLTIEILEDDLAHFEVSNTPFTADTIWTSSMIAKTDYTGASALTLPAPNLIETPEMRLTIDTDALCITVTDITRTPEITLTTICPTANQDRLNGLSLSKEGTTDIYGLGENFPRRAQANGNWMGSRRTMLNSYGNELTSFSGGNVGNAQFPIMYALGEGTQNYAFFLDNVYQQYWTFNADPFTVTMSNQQSAPIRAYIMTGENLPDLRRDYMELTGFPPVPPKQAFGLWVSEYGYENWDELNAELADLRAANFPLDGFMLDLQWFGGISPSEQSQMGALAWDETNFPNPAEFIADLRANHGAGIMLIEEPYVSIASRGYDQAVENGVLVRDCAELTCDPIRADGWWGNGGMVDWSDPQAAAWWHDTRRQALVEDGVVGHWTDLGEPELYSEAGYYHGFPELNRHDHASIHNMYNFFWSQSIWDGYARNAVERRPFSLSRSGTSGSQRFGVSMWSGDIAANMESLSAHMNAQMHMSLSGVDYFGSDVGGFYRQVFDPVLGVDGMYTVWLANSALLDVPLRPHASNLQNQHETSPARIGDIASNLANVRLRYALTPYLYMLAHHAAQHGDPLFAPLVYYFQDDPEVRALGRQKMIGASLMMTALTDYDLEAVPVYLPAGGWFNYYTNEYIVSAGEWIEVSSIVDGITRAPLFVREGAIIPHMRVDEDTFTVLGARRNGDVDHTLVINIYGEGDGTFTLIEDDGETIAYRDGAIRETPISISSTIVTIGAAQGTFEGAPDAREVIVNRITAETSETQTGTWNADTPLNIDFTPQTATASPVVTGLETMERPLLMAHYMPWYQTPDVSGYWGWHWTMDHFDPAQTDENGRREIASQYMPLTGAYDSQDDAVLEYQVLLMRLSGIDGVIVDWYGTSSYRDYLVNHQATVKLFDYISRAGLQFIICYEDQTVLHMVNGGRLTTDTAIDQGRRDMQYANEHWFNHPAYVQYEDQPLVFVFGPQYFRSPENWTAIFDGITPSPALVTLDGHMGFAALSMFPWPPMHYAGGTTMAPAVLENYFDLFFRNARRSDIVVGGAFPAFHDIYAEAGVRASYGFIDPRDGETLRYTLDESIARNSRIVQLITWNDYGEGTVIEPTEETGYQYLEIVQERRQTLEDNFSYTPDDLRLPMRLFNLRRQYPADADINAHLDEAFAAIVADDLITAENILKQYE